MSYGRAFALVIAAALLSSASGIFIREMGTIGDWQIAFWRYLVQGASLTLLLALWYRGRLVTVVRRMGWVGAAGSALFGASSIMVVTALHNTAIADVMFLLGAVPLITALLARILLGEAVRRATWFAMAGALVGITLMVAAGLGSETALGTLLGLGAALAFAGFGVVLRWGRTIDMVPIIATGSVRACLTSLPFVAGSMAINGRQLALFLVWAGVVSPANYTMFVIGSRHLPGAELMLALPAETIFAGTLAWLVVGEVPSNASLAGGTIVIVSVVGLAFVRLANRSPPIGRGRALPRRMT